MLTTLIYQSKCTKPASRFVDHDFLRKIREKNKALKISGIILNNGVDFFQIIEGSESAVDSIFRKIRSDLRHTEVVELMRDYSSRRFFDSFGMEYYDLSRYKDSSGYQAYELAKKLWVKISRNERVSSFVQAFILKGRSNALRPDLAPSAWVMSTDKSRQGIIQKKLTLGYEYTFALQPVVEPLQKKIISFETLIRGCEGVAPAELFSLIPAGEIYQFDLNSKYLALRLASQILRDKETVSINLLPGSLSTSRHSVNRLINFIETCNLQPHQVTVEIIENELIMNMDSFHDILKDIRASGLGLAIDDFGSGYSRLSLLSRIQPDVIKLDRDVIQDIHLSGAKQAMVASLIRYSSDMGIRLIAEGVEQIEEWCWLQSAGITLYQGYLFSRPCITGVGTISWPVKK
ncbi:diguanylate phosphodiesterase [Enterobacter sp. RD4-1-1]|uniref:diguanylate phosphodiesterase n=1 Tax=Enterobacter sp. RD4-1-1 TaxID=2986135 RepID=UPI0021E71C3C|nr:diguanylate phosphodiesterase [Enterobacter sp. RD4-1-1]MCV3773683.1 diguanylate phosphodiesterase [Enterobacter sp. RD4-1-1]